MKQWPHHQTAAFKYRSQRVLSVAACVAMQFVAMQMLTSSAVQAADSPKPSIVFQDQVIAAVSKGGCNSGRCHGNASGRGGFKLSLRGQRPADDFYAIAMGAESRRVNRAYPHQSLILLKATSQVPHEGGLRFPMDSPEYKAIVEWIQDGLAFEQPPQRVVQRIDVTPTGSVLEADIDRLQLQVKVIFDDDSVRDVTQLAIYEPAGFGVTVSRNGLVERQSYGQSTIVVRYLQKQIAVNVAFLRPADTFTFTAPEPVNGVDEAVFAQLEKLRINPSGETSDVEFLRRAHFDLIGQLPTADVARSFLSDPSPGKRADLIDRLLASARFADHWARKWADLLRVEEKTMDAKGVEVFYGWIRDAIANDTPQNEFVRAILSATGSTYEEPPSNFYRAVRKPDLRAEAVAQVFLGTRLQCAKCHDHPFERWSQDDYHDFTALFAPVQYKIVENKRKDGLDKNQFIGEQVVWIDSQKSHKNPDTGKQSRSRFLGESEPTAVAAIDRLRVFSDWLTTAEHPLFAPVIANRVWAEMLGRGIVEPVDDFRITNPPSNPELLRILTQTFVDSGFRLRPLIRMIANSRVYQLSSGQKATRQTDAHLNEKQHSDEKNFARASLSRLPAEVLLDAIDQVTNVPSSFDGYDRGTRAGQLPGVNKTYRRETPKGGLKFLELFGKPARIMTCACERMNETTLGQVFELTSGKLIHQKLSDENNAVDELMQQQLSETEIVDELYWRTLSRPATDTERTSLSGYVTEAKDKRRAYEDVLWGLINSKEFLMRR